MIRAVLDTNVLVATLLSSAGAPAAIVAAWLAGGFEVVTSPRQLDELRRVLSYPRIAARVSPEIADPFVTLIERHAVVADDGPGEGLAPDPDDEFIVALVRSSADVLVTGDAALLDAALPITTVSPRDFLDALAG